VHALAPDKARVETVFIRRRDGYVSSAMTAFLDIVRPRSMSALAAE
jgi:hypothetical protein